MFLQNNSESFHFRVPDSFHGLPMSLLTQHHRRIKEPRVALICWHFIPPPRQPAGRGDGHHHHSTNVFPSQTPVSQPNTTAAGTFASFLSWVPVAKLPPAATSINDVHHHISRQQAAAAAAGTLVLMLPRQQFHSMFLLLLKTPWIQAQYSVSDTSYITRTGDKRMEEQRKTISSSHSNFSK